MSVVFKKIKCESCKEPTVIIVGMKRRCYFCYAKDSKATNFIMTGEQSKAFSERIHNNLVHERNDEFNRRNKL